MQITEVWIKKVHNPLKRDLGEYWAPRYMVNNHAYPYPCKPMHHEQDLVQLLQNALDNKYFKVIVWYGKYKEVYYLGEKKENECGINQQKGDIPFFFYCIELSDNLPRRIV